MEKAAFHLSFLLVNFV